MTRYEQIKKMVSRFLTTTDGVCYHSHMNYENDWFYYLPNGGSVNAKIQGEEEVLYINEILPTIKTVNNRKLNTILKKMNTYRKVWCGCKIDDKKLKDKKIRMFKKIMKIESEFKHA